MSLFTSIVGNKINIKVHNITYFFSGKKGFMYLNSECDRRKNTYNLGWGSIVNQSIPICYHTNIPIIINK